MASTFFGFISSLFGAVITTITLFGMARTWLRNRSEKQRIHEAIVAPPSPQL